MGSDCISSRSLLIFLRYKWTRFAVSLLSALHVRYCSTNWTISSFYFFLMLEYFLSKRACAYEGSHAVETQLCRHNL